MPGAALGSRVTHLVNLLGGELAPALGVVAHDVGGVGVLLRVLTGGFAGGKFVATGGWAWVGWGVAEAVSIKNTLVTCFKASSAAFTESKDFTGASFVGVTEAEVVADFMGERG